MEFEKVKKVLVANRGEIACRIIRSCKEANLKAVSIFCKEDVDSLHVAEADEAVLIPGTGATAYIDIKEIVKVAKETQCQVAVPGYGLLSENSEFTAALEQEGILFAGPTSETVECFGLKHFARDLAVKNSVPVVPGSGLIQDLEHAMKEASQIGYPVMLKASAGGGGMGLKVCYSESELKANLEEVKSRGTSLFKNSDVFLEKYVENGRHIEVQVFGNGDGDVLAFGERECSIQRRHQKVIEEAPSPFIEMKEYNHSELRKNLCKCACALASGVKYRSAGTVEFLVDNDTGDFYFLEMNTRLQVEHGITELCYGVDLVHMMLLQTEYQLRGNPGIPLDVMKAMGTYKLTEDGVPVPYGHAIECRAYAENPIRNFQPSPGILHNVEFPETGTNCKVRVDHWVSTGSKISPYFDPLLAKVMVWAETREAAIEGMIKLLEDIKLQGPPTNIEYCKEILKSNNFKSGFTLTSFLSKSFEFKPCLIEFEEAGIYTTIQDFPGRIDYNGGVPLGGPVDPLSLQMGNIIVGNDTNGESLEITMKGPVIKFHSAATVCLTGAPFEFKIQGGDDLPMFTAIDIPPNTVIEIGMAAGHGSKCYLTVKGGFPDVAEYLGSKSCSPALNLGGHQGRIILPGDCLSVIGFDYRKDQVSFGYSLPQKCRPNFDLPEDHIWTIRMLRGPHDSDEIVGKEGRDALYDTTYHVNLNSNRGAQRLDGPALNFSRESGGDGGSHPSNILEYPYPVCGLSAVGSVMTLFGVDGATLSGFVCVSVPIKADWWKFGQAKTGAAIKFELIGFEDAVKLSKSRADYLKYLETKPGESNAIPFDDSLDKTGIIDDPILYHRDASEELPVFNLRQAGEGMILGEFGIDKYLLSNNGRQKVLLDKFEKYMSSNPNIKSSIIRCDVGTSGFSVLFDPFTIDREIIIKILSGLEKELPPTSELKVTSTLYKLPVCFDHSAIDHCIERYMHSQRPYASYLPNNKEFLMEATCLDSYEQFKELVLKSPVVVTCASFLCANTLLVHPDPRLRFKGPKYNPARTFTPRGAIGSAGVSHSIYSIDSAGGYQMWGMTLPNICWDTFSRIKMFNNQPWFFQCFDQVQFYEVDEAELDELNKKLVSGHLKVETSTADFDFGSYGKFLEEIKDDYEELSKRQELAFAKIKERENSLYDKWLLEKEAAKESKNADEAILNDPNNVRVDATMAANVFKINFKRGEIVKASDVLIILEAMKMEIPMRIKTPREGVEDYEILEVIVDENDMVNPGDCLVILKPIEA